jgi:4-hydroxy-tetrahydrodipicolinate synthase
MTDNYGIDNDGLKQLVDFQVEEGVSGVLAVGTTGESPTLDWGEHNTVIEKIHEAIKQRCTTIAGTGSNSTWEALKATEHALECGVKCILLVDPYYNGPSSIEIRREYVEPIARKFPDIQVIPYIIPGRTGTQLLPQDLALLHSQLSNVNAVKEATGDLLNMKRTRSLCGENFSILSGDDDKTHEMMTDPEIRSSGVISVASNVAPGAVQRFTHSILEGKLDEAMKLRDALAPLFSTVTVKTEEETSYGRAVCKARNPLPVKTLVNTLGMPSGPCRPPLGRMTEKALQVVLNAARTIYERTPEILEPIEKFFDVDLQDRLYKESSWRRLSYD